MSSEVFSRIPGSNCKETILANNYVHTLNLRYLLVWNINISTLFGLLMKKIEQRTGYDAQWVCRKGSCLQNHS